MNLVCRGPAGLLSQLIEDVLGIALEVEMIRRLGLERGGVPADADMRNGVRGGPRPPKLGWLGSRSREIGMARSSRWSCSSGSAGQGHRLDRALRLTVRGLTMGEDRCALRGGLRCSGSARDTISRTTEEG